MLKKIKLLGVGITNENEENILEYIFSSLEKQDTKYYIVTPNPEILTYASSNPEYKKILNEARIAIPDGVGVFLGSAFLGHPLKERIPGVDFLEELCKRSVRNTASIGFLGAGPGVAKRTAERLMKKYPSMRVRFVGPEWEMGKDKNNRTKNGKDKVTSDTERHSEIAWISPYISPSDPIDILFIAYGFPKQEQWIANNLANIPVKVAMGVGGAFDYISGDVIRAPFIIRAMGFEWLFRLVHQPWRWRRQLSLFIFIWLVLKERLDFKTK